MSYRDLQGARSRGTSMSQDSEPVGVGVSQAQHFSELGRNTWEIKPYPAENSRMVWWCGCFFRRGRRATSSKWSMGRSTLEPPAARSSHPGWASVEGCYWDLRIEVEVEDPNKTIHDATCSWDTVKFWQLERNLAPFSFLILNYPHITVC